MKKLIAGILNVKPVYVVALLAICFTSCGVESENSEVKASASTTKTLTITSNISNLNMLQLEYREAATRTNLPGCSIKDVLQNTGWGPKVFHSEIQSKNVGGKPQYVFGNQGPIAKYCAAKNDNVANFVAFTVPGKPESIYGSAPVKFGPGTSSSVTVNCKKIDEGYGVQYTCGVAKFNNAANLQLKLNIN